MPSARNQKAKSRKSGEMDILSDYANMDVMLGEADTNSIMRELNSIINGREGQQDLQSLSSRELSSQGNEIRDTGKRNGSLRQERLSESINILSDEMNASFSRNGFVDDVLQSQINRKISSAIKDRVIPEIQNIMRRLPLNRNGPEPSTSLTEDSIGNAWKNKNTKVTKKESTSACERRYGLYSLQSVLVSLRICYTNQTRLRY